ncbi:Biotin synthase [bacterium HR29]|jgi:biotin synthase|nr:Biotin synthase [bacterium HR29]
MVDWQAVERGALAGEPLPIAVAEALVGVSPPDLLRLVAIAHAARLRHHGPGTELEALISAKTGGCPEDCRFCSQSMHFETGVAAHPFLDPDEVVRRALEAEAQGARQFCIVAAVRGPNERLLRSAIAAVEAVRTRTSLEVHASLGILAPDDARRLAAAGVRRYNHNLETARSFFPRVVTTHTWEERYRTCIYAREAGMEVCSGGIFGMGEGWPERLEFAEQLRTLDPAEIPINFLDPRPGTPLGGRPLLEPLEAVHIIALFRLLFPRASIRVSGGRERVLRDLQALALLAGANGIVLGNYLTTRGRSAADDLQMLRDLGLTDPDA